jgi:hypothetical protein
VQFLRREDIDLGSVLFETVHARGIQYCSNKVEIASSVNNTSYGRTQGVRSQFLDRVLELNVGTKGNNLFLGMSGTS